MNETLQDKTSEIFYRANTTYEITVNPDNQYFDKIDRLVKMASSFSAHIDALKEVSTFQFIVEQSEPRYGNKHRGSDSRLHFHGTIRFLDEVSIGKFLLNIVNKLKKYGDFSINTYRPDVWDDYMDKQKHIMLPLCKAYHVPYVYRSDKPIYKSIRKVST